MALPLRALVSGVSAPGLALAAALGLCACQGGGGGVTPPMIELRLVPCDVGGPPGSMRLVIEALDAGGARVGDAGGGASTLSAADLADGLVTAGYRPPAGAVAATFTIAWFAGASAGALSESDHVVVLPKLPLPPLGEALELPALGCMPLVPGTTSDGTTSGSGSASEGTTSAGTSDTGSTGTGSTSEGTTSAGTSDTSTGADTTTGTGTGTSTGTGTGTSTGTSTGMGTDTGTTGGDPPMDGLPCDPDLDPEPVCVTPGPGEVGELLACAMVGDVWVWQESAAALCDGACATPIYGFEGGVAVGCSGNGSGLAWGCLCGEGIGDKPCVPADTKCALEGMDEALYLCLKGALLKGICPGLCVGDPQPICAP
ncbi:MAG: hypothetical protein H6710_09755 [Myxococcales bacterium]|nr:hypothetical protein [Myxococcales bacterium]